MSLHNITSTSASHTLATSIATRELNRVKAHILTCIESVRTFHASNRLGNDCQPMVHKLHQLLGNNLVDWTVPPRPSQSQYQLFISPVKPDPYDTENLHVYGTVEERYAETDTALRAYPYINAAQSPIQQGLYMQEPTTFTLYDIPVDKNRIPKAIFKICDLEDKTHASIELGLWNTSGRQIEGHSTLLLYSNNVGFLYCDPSAATKNDRVTDNPSQFFEHLRTYDKISLKVIKDERQVMVKQENPGAGHPVSIQGIRQNLILADQRYRDSEELGRLLGSKSVTEVDQGVQRILLSSRLDTVVGVLENKIENIHNYMVWLTCNQHPNVLVKPNLYTMVLRLLFSKNDKAQQIGSNVLINSHTKQCDMRLIDDLCMSLSSETRKVSLEQQFESCFKGPHTQKRVLMTRMMYHFLPRHSQEGINILSQVQVPLNEDAHKSVSLLASWLHERAPIELLHFFSVSDVPILRYIRAAELELQVTNLKGTQALDYCAASPYPTMRDSARLCLQRLLNTNPQKVHEILFNYQLSRDVNKHATARDFFEKNR